jgi:Uma2 family endonuclease
MAVQERLYTVEEFDDIVQLPENANRLLEYIGGSIVEVVSMGYSSEIGATVLSEIKVFTKRHNLGRVTGADGGYMVSGERYIPDAAFISITKQPEPSYAAYNPIPPDLAVEVLSPSNTNDEMRIQIVNYLLAGTTVWIFDPDHQKVEIYVPDQSPRKLGIDDTIDGVSVLPGFTLAIRDVFA